MNIITAEMAVAVFPFSTFIKRKSYVTKPYWEAEERTLRWTNKYIRRGFEVLDRNALEPYGSFRVGPRALLDSRSWIMRFSRSWHSK